MIQPMEIYGGGVSLAMDMLQQNDLPINQAFDSIQAVFGRLGIIEK
jgi:hypothetical protein